MSISTQIAALTEDKIAIANALTTKGVDATGHGFDDFAEDVAAIPTGNLPQNFTKFTSGTFTPTEDIHDITIAHGLGAIPDMVIVYPISGEPTAYTTNGILISGRELQNSTGSQWYSYGNATFEANASRSTQGFYSQFSTPNQGLKAADNVSFTVCTYHGVNYYWCSDVTYRWLAFTQEVQNATI